MVFSRASSAGCTRDIRGSVHIVEVLVVGLMVMGAMVAVSTLHSTVERPDDPSHVSEDKAREILDVLRALPAENTSVHHTHRLEELILQDLAGDTATLPRLLRSYHFTDHRLVLQTGASNIVVTGPENLTVQDIPDGASAHWYSQSGTTLIRPAVSHQDAEMDAWFELLPVWADHVPQPPGHEWAVEVSLREDGTFHNRTTVFHHRLPVDDQRPVRIEPRHEDGTDAWVYTETQVTNGTEYEWDLHLRITPGGDQERIWLAEGDRYELLPPPGWSLADLHADWLDLTEGDTSAIHLEHTGRSKRGDEEAWLNLSLERPTSSALTHHEALRVRTESPVGAETTIVLSPDSSRPAPVLVAASRPDPFSPEQALPVTLTIANPTDRTLDLDRLRVRFAAASQFPYTPAGWTRASLDDAVVYEYDGPAVELGAYEAKPIVLDVQVRDATDGDNRDRVHPPVLEHLGAGNLTPPERDGLLPESWADAARRSVALPGTQAGLWGAWIDVDGLGNGTHTARVGHVETDRVPPGTGQFIRVNESTQGFLPGLQEARYDMALELEPRTLVPGDELVVRLRTAGLAAYLSENQDQLTGEPLRFEAQAGGLTGHLIGNVEADGTVTQAPALLGDGETLELTLPFSRSATPGPLIVDARLVIPTQDHGEITLHFLAAGTVSSEEAEFTPVFHNAHLQFWLGGMREGPEASS